MTKEASSNNAVHNERLMVAVRIRPTEHLSEANRVVSALSEKALLFTEGPSSPNYSSDKNLSDPESVYGSSGGGSKGGGGLYSSSFGQLPPAPPTAATSRLNRSNPVTQNGNGSGGFPTEGRVYDFDHVFDDHASQEQVYQSTTAPLVKSVFEGFCATVFAYGATSSGKTYTMVGTQSDPGIMKRAIDDIFIMCSDPERETKAEVYLSYLEIYNEKIRDLLRPIPGVNLELREDMEQVHVSGLSEIRATSTNEVLNLLTKGNKARTMEPTAANVASSRSHAILLITVRQFAQDDSEVTDGKLYLIDLAGSERASQTKNSGLRLREGGHINRSLLALGNCITALAAGDDKYINYRDSKLTRLLKAALGGPSKTVMIAHVSPSIHQREETRNTLLYGQRARAISNRVRKFIYPGQSSETGYIIDELRNEVRRLQTKLEERSSSPSQGGSIFSPSSFQHLHNFPSKSTTPIPIQTPLHPNPEGGKFYHEGYLDKHEKHELVAIKKQISNLFEDEFRLRNDLLKLDGAMLQSALDCEILRLMVLDWENVKNVQKESRDEEEIDAERSEIHTVMNELKQVRQEQDKLLGMRTDVEQDLRKVRNKIAQFEEEASQYLPEIQREILSLLCRLQQDQLNKMSVEIEAELKRRGSLLLRCLRQKALGEAIIHRQRHFISALSGGGGSLPRTLETSPHPHQDLRFLPPLASPAGSSSSKPDSADRIFAASSIGDLTSRNHLPPLNSSVNHSSSNNLIPKTTKYSDFRQQRLIQRQLQSSSEDDYEEKETRYQRGSPRKTIKSHKSSYPSY